MNTDVTLAQIKDSMMNKLLKKLYQSNIHIFHKLLLCTVLLKTHLKRNNPLKIAKELNLIPNTGCRGNFNHWCKIWNKKGQGIVRKSLDVKVSQTAGTWTYPDWVKVSPRLLVWDPLHYGPNIYTRSPMYFI